MYAQQMALDSTPPPLFHIAIVGPPGQTFPSFKSTDLKKIGFGNLKFQLFNIRDKAMISTKFLFTADGKTSISDDTTLEYYMGLSAEGRNVLKKAVENSETVETFRVTLIPKTSTNRSMPEVSAVKEPMEQTGKTTLQYPEPAELTEAQWDVVLKNTRAFHGYYYDFKKGTVRKAPKPAFRLRPDSTLGFLISHDDAYAPPIPPYYLCNSSSVKVIEIRDQIQDTLVKEGFDSLVVSGSLGGDENFPGSISASSEREYASSRQKYHVTEVKSLAVTYNLPRVVVELGPEFLELTPEYKADLENVARDRDRKRFQRRYGTVFATSITLGGYLYSTRSITSNERSNLEHTKDQTRKAAGLSFTSPQSSSSFGIAHKTGGGREIGHAELYQTTGLTWDAYGGNTLLVSNPNTWVSTVHDHRLWQLMNQRHIVDLAFFSTTVDHFADYIKKDPFKDEDYGKEVYDLITKAFKGDPDDKVATKIKALYEAGKYNAVPHNTEYNVFMTNEYPEDDGALIKKGTLFDGLTEEQRIDVGMYLVYKEELSVEIPE